MFAKTGKALFELHGVNNVLN